MSSWTTKQELFTKEEAMTRRQEVGEELPVCSFHPPECQSYEAHLTKEGNLLPPTPHHPHQPLPFSRCLAWPEQHRGGTGREEIGGKFGAF